MKLPTPSAASRSPHRPRARGRRRLGRPDRGAAASGARIVASPLARKRAAELGYDVTDKSHRSTTRAWHSAFLRKTRAADKAKMSMKGYEGYYETARFVAETAFTLAPDSPKLRAGKDHVRGGVLTPAIAGRNVLVRSGMGFIDWSKDSKMPQADANFNMIPLKSNADAAE